VGSSTLYPFVTVIAEDFGRHSKYKTPIVESNGTGGGFNLFCLGIGADFPDLVNASRPIKPSEVKFCKEHHVTDIVEIVLGYDGIVIANVAHGQNFKLSKQQLFLALAKKVPLKGKLVDNYYLKWSDINVSLPQQNITIYGPSSTSGTRDALDELVMSKICMDMGEFQSAWPNKSERAKHCSAIRNDEKFIEMGDNDNVIIQKLSSNQLALGIIGYNFLSQNHELVKPAFIDGVVPDFTTIASKEYSISRPLYIYLKSAHLKLIPGLLDFMQTIVADKTIGNDGYLLIKGLVPQQGSELIKSQEKISSLQL
jgi:phosphate transport system substrate-binding protein